MGPNSITKIGYGHIFLRKGTLVLIIIILSTNCKTILKIPKGYPEAVSEGQTPQWPKENLMKGRT